MELEELQQRLLPFCQAHYETRSVIVDSVSKMPGHAGFAYGFGVRVGDRVDTWFLRLPPPDVRLEGTADVLRQVAVLNALDGYDVPHCAIKWSGDDPKWFGRPYFVVKQLQGDVVRQQADGWVGRLDAPKRRDMARQAMSALANIHQLDWRDIPYLGQPVSLVDDVERWDRFLPKVADPQRLELAPRVKELLLKRLPEDGKIGIFHGDFQWSNLFYSPSGKLLAVIDWELVGIGTCLNDLGWIACFNDPLAWAQDRNEVRLMPEAEELLDLYAQASDSTPKDVNWYRALAAYKFAIISGFNLMLHRRGKRDDPLWEQTKESIEPLLQRALQLLG